VSSLVTRASDGLVFVTLTAAPTGRPAWAAGTHYFMIAAENSEAGKKQFAMLLAA
jgi:hypothetical protein